MELENDNFEAAYEAEAQNNAYDDAWNDLNRLIAEKNKRSDLIAQDKPADNSVRIPVIRQPAAPSRQGGDRPFFVPSKADRDRGEGGVFGNAAQALVNGAVEGVNNTLEAAYQAAIFWDQNFGGKVMPAELPDIPKPFDVPDTTVNTIVSTIGQFVVPFGAAGKAMGAAKLGTNVAASFPKAAKIARPMIQGAIADFSAFDGHEARLSNLIESVPTLQNPVSEYLAASEDDSELEGRFKNAVEGLGIGAAADGLFKCLSAVKAARKARRIAKEENLKPVEERFVPKVAKEDLSALGDPDGELLVKGGAETSAEVAEKAGAQSAAPAVETVMDISSETAKEALSAEGKNTLWENAISFLKGKVGAKIHNASLGADIEIRQNSVNKYKKFSAKEEKQVLAYYIPDLLEKADFSIMEKSYILKAEANIKSYRKADMVVSFNGQPKHVHLTVKETADGNFFWDAQIKETPYRSLSRTQSGGGAGISSKIISKPAESVNSENVYINFARIDTPDDIKKVMAELADASRESIDKARRFIFGFCVKNKITRGSRRRGLKSGDELFTLSSYLNEVIISIFLFVSENPRGIRGGFFSFAQRLFFGFQVGSFVRVGRNDFGGGFFIRVQARCAGNAPAFARHDFGDIAQRAFAFFSPHDHFAHGFGVQSVDAGRADFDFSGACDTDGFGDAARQREVARLFRCRNVESVVFALGGINVERRQPRAHFFKIHDIVDKFVPQSFAAFGNARTDEHGHAVRISFLCQFRRVVHRRRRFGHERFQFGGDFFHHFAVSRATRRRHELVAAFHSFGEVFGFVFRCDIGAFGDFDHFEKARFRQSGGDFVNSRGVLSRDGGGEHGDDVFSFFDFSQNVDNLAFFGDGAERAVRHALTAAQATRGIDFGIFFRVFGNRADGAGIFARNFGFGDRAVGADLHALGAFFTFVVVDVGTTVLDGNRAERASRRAGARDAAAAQVGDVDASRTAAFARRIDDGHDRCVGLFAFQSAARVFGQGCFVVVVLDGAAHGGDGAFAQDGAFFVNAATIGHFRVFGAHIERQIVGFLFQFVRHERFEQANHDFASQKDGVGFCRHVYPLFPAVDEIQTRAVFIGRQNGSV